MRSSSRRPWGGGVGRRLVFRRPAREAVPAAGTRDFDPPGSDGGSASVREPRRPKPLGPLSDAGELPVPEPPKMIVLPDPRR